MSGSLDSWKAPVVEEQYNSIYNILGYEIEQIAPGSKIDNCIGSTDGHMMIMSNNIMMTDRLFPRAPPQLPPHLPLLHQHMCHKEEESLNLLQSNVCRMHCQLQLQHEAT